MEDWIAYTVRVNNSSTFKDVARPGSQLADWVWLLVALSLTVLNQVVVEVAFEEPHFRKNVD